MNKKAKFTVIDFLIILVAAAVIAVGIIKIGPVLVKRTGNEQVEFTIQITGKDEGFSETMKEGDKVTLSLTEKDGGIIKGIETTSAQTMVFDSLTGEYKIVTLDEKEDIYLTVEANCAIDEKAISVGDTKIKVGTDIPVRGKGYATSGFIIAVND